MCTGTIIAAVAFRVGAGRRRGRVPLSERGTEEGGVCGEGVERGGRLKANEIIERNQLHHRVCSNICT